jgi:hypothetical protein
MGEQIFEGKTFQDLTKDIYDNANQKKKQIEVLIKEMNKMITSIDEVILIAPIIKEYLEVGVKNDEHLVKLAGVLQRIISKSTGDTDESSLLSESEKEELMVTLQETVNDLQVENDRISDIAKKSHLSK